MEWTKDDPKVDGVYWWRSDAKDNDPDIHEVAGESFYQVGFGSSEWVANFGGEWLGPITSEQAEQFDALRKAAEDALRYFEDTGESCRTADIVTALRRALGKEQSSSTPVER